MFPRPYEKVGQKSGESYFTYGFAYTMADKKKEKTYEILFDGKNMHNKASDYFAFNTWQLKLKEAEAKDVRGSNLFGAQPHRNHPAAYTPCCLYALLCDS
eukprot:GHVS01050670.1.p1 GENE.GHVS01050670.1~~GHVS01050670.1.p1  ORF type:complete len:100 (+),score=9.45 GHVS01050670.1:193-492(+)